MSRQLALLAVLLLGGCRMPEPEPAAPTSPIDLRLPSVDGSLAPWLATDSGGRLQATWLEPAGSEAHALRWSRLESTGWSPPLSLVEGSDLLANWADTPSFRPLDDGLLATWPQSLPEAPHAYDVRLVRLRGERPKPVEDRPHRDGTATEHGFAQVTPSPGGGLGVVWLDGREYARTDGLPPSMNLRFATLDAEGQPGPSVILDARTCDCCPLAVAKAGEALLVAYRDRSDDGEIRDIAWVRGTAAGWSEPRVVHEDGWEIPGCPVNGPAMAARGDDVVLAWFTGAGGQAEVRIALSADGGGSFGPPSRVDGGSPTGRVAVAWLPDGDAAVAWLEEDELRLRRWKRDGSFGATTSVAPVAPGRSAGMPRLVAFEAGLAAAWTSDEEPPRVRVARLGPPPA